MNEEPGTYCSFVTFYIHGDRVDRVESTLTKILDELDLDYEINETGIFIADSQLGGNK